MLNVNSDPIVSPISWSSVGEILTTLRMHTLRNAISHTLSNMLSNTDSCACTGTVKGVFPTIARADNQANRRNRGKGKDSSNYSINLNF